MATPGLKDVGALSLLSVCSCCQTLDPKDSCWLTACFNTNPMRLLAFEIVSESVSFGHCLLVSIAFVLARSRYLLCLAPQTVQFSGETETFGKRARQCTCSVTSESVSDARHFETLTLSTTCKQCFIEKEQTLLLFKACISIVK